MTELFAILSIATGGLITVVKYFVDRVKECDEFEKTQYEKRINQYRLVDSLNIDKEFATKIKQAL
jgi:lipid A disaccharide synthetase